MYNLEGFIRLLTHFVCIYVAFWALQSIRVDQWFKKNSSQQIRILFLFVAIVLGYLTSTFLLEILTILRNFWLMSPLRGK